MKDNRLSIENLPVLPQDQDGPVFNQPWEAKSFALPNWDRVSLRLAGKQDTLLPGR